jgi:hypothetical protein
MKKRLLVSALLYFLFQLNASAEVTYFGRSQASDSVSALKSGKNTIWLNGGQIARREYQLSYERFLNQWFALEVGLGYKYAVNAGQPYEVSIPSLYNGEFYNFAERMPFSQGIFTSLAFKAYMTEKTFKGGYASGQLFYRYRFYDHQFVSSGVMASEDPKNWDSQQSLDLHIFGAKFLLGRTMDLVRFKNKSAIMLDLYGGLGFRNKFAKTTFFSKKSTNSGSYYTPPGYTPPPATTVTQPKPWTENSENGMISVQAGLKLGFRF